jgi:peptide/nickel transport system permease protein
MEPSNLSGTVAERTRQLPPVVFFKRLVKEKPLGTVGAIITLLLLLTGIFPDLIAPHGMNEDWVGTFLEPPSSKLWFGSDNLGRDVFSRVIYGARISVIVGLSASAIATVISLIIGTIGGYIGGRLDFILQRFVDICMTIPQLVLMIVFISIIGTGMLQVILVIGLLWGVVGSRIVRSAVIGIKENVYLGAARATGCSTLKILIRHILPNIMAPTIILFTTRVPNAILVESSLSFLGFGIPPPAPSWGGMISGAGSAYMLRAPWMIIFPGLALASVVYGVNIFGDALRDLLDPRLVGGVGRFGVREKKEEKEVTVKSEPGAGKFDRAAKQ